MQITLIQISGALPRALPQLVQILERVHGPGAVPHTSSLPRGEETRRTVDRLLTEAGGDRKLARKLLLEELRRRYPGFKAVPDSPGFHLYDRCRRKLLQFTSESQVSDSK